MATITTALDAQASLRSSGDLSSSFATSTNALQRAEANAVDVIITHTPPTINVGGVQVADPVSESITQFETSADGTTWAEVGERDAFSGQLKPLEVRVNGSASRQVTVPKDREWFRAKDRGTGTASIAIVPKQLTVVAP